MPENETLRSMRHPAHNSSNSSALAYMCRFMGGMMVKRMPPRYGSSMLSRVRDARPPESTGFKFGYANSRYKQGAWYAMDDKHQYRKAWCTEK
jgi:hypothetical protein